MYNHSRALFYFGPCHKKYASREILRKISIAKKKKSNGLKSKNSYKNLRSNTLNSFNLES